MYLIHPGKKQFKANLHSHSTLSDGNLTPEEMKAAYKAKGYSVLCISDHERTNDFSHMTEPDFLMLTGYEAYIRPNYIYDFFGPEVHLNLLARDPHNVSLVYFHPTSSRYLSDEQKAAVPKVGPLVERQYTTEFVNDFIRCAKDNGYIVTYNHPVWSLESQERIASYEGFCTMEICNWSSFNTGGCNEYNLDLYHKLLRSGKRVFAHSADDNHNKFPFDHVRCDSFGGAAMILADKLEYDQVFHAIETGEMYSTMGPVIHEVSFDGEQVHISCSDAVQIACYCGGKSAIIEKAQTGQVINKASLTVRPGALFVQISVTDKDGKRADTRGYFRDELGLPPVE